MRLLLLLLKSFKRAQGGTAALCSHWPVGSRALQPADWPCRAVRSGHRHVILNVIAIPGDVRMGRDERHGSTTLGE
ncbi:hypothetical protein P280DRAFT_471732 [Massarina eburnea CBS 473.64]|uniref:Secreted protein n=1 Tax=Massarina eburnea CBS 473.64 TaxID=1395130 RepID=A0A6A6RSP5_9PLEO|nr:hypothetical protein P280DRAFT_471732 [Massarina eburnea CBS 473.64]